MDSAFVSAKSALALVPTLVHPDPSAWASLAVYASDSHVGAVFQQLVWVSWAPLAFTPRSSLLPRHSTPPLTMNSWLPSPPWTFLFPARRSRFHLVYKPLTFALFTGSLPWSARQKRHLSYLSKFTSDLIHLPNLQNVVADALSRPSSAASASTVDVVQVSGLNPFGDILPEAAPSCQVHPFSGLQPLSSTSSREWIYINIFLTLNIYIICSKLGLLLHCIQGMNINILYSKLGLLLHCIQEWIYILYILNWVCFYTVNIWRNNTIILEALNYTKN